MITSDGVNDDTTLLGSVQSSVNILSCSVLPTIGMSAMKQFMVEGLSKIRLDTYTVKYKVPTWLSYDNSEPVFGLIHNLEDINSCGDLHSALVDTGVSSNKVRFMLSFLEKFLEESDKCPICLEGFQVDNDVSIISPCFHFVCKTCMKRCLVSSNYCPMCRVTISGILDVLPVKTPSIRTFDTSSKTFEELLGFNVGQNISMGNNCGAIVASLYIENVHKKLVVLSPYSNFHVMLKRSVSRIGVFDVDIRGVRRKNFQDRLEWFGVNSEDTLKVLCISDIRELSWLSEISGVDAICDVRVSVRKLDKDPISFFSRISRIRSGNDVRIFNVTPWE